jgi:hypothetical protein
MVKRPNGLLGYIHSAFGLPGPKAYFAETYYAYFKSDEN